MVDRNNLDVSVKEGTALFDLTERPHLVQRPPHLPHRSGRSIRYHLLMRCLDATSQFYTSSTFDAAYFLDSVCFAIADRTLAKSDVQSNAPSLPI